MMSLRALGIRILAIGFLSVALNGIGGIKEVNSSESYPSVMDMDTKEFFRLYDTNRDGVVSGKEARAFRNTIIYLLDTDRDGKIDIKDVAPDREAEIETKVHALARMRFKSLDKSNDGTISLEEFFEAFSSVVAECGLIASREIAGQPPHPGYLVMAADANKDGIVDLEEMKTTENADFRTMDKNRDGKVTPVEHWNVSVIRRFGTTRDRPVIEGDPAIETNAEKGCYMDITTWAY